MKKLIIIITAAVIAGGLASCKKFLDRQPLSYLPDNSSNDTVPLKTAEDAENALSAVYSAMKNGQSELYMLDYYVNGDAQSDNSYAGADNPANFQIDEYKIDATNSNVSRDWAYFYGLISRTNNVIQNVPKITDAALTATRKD